jgi:hypothetical protein
MPSSPMILIWPVLSAPPRAAAIRRALGSLAAKKPEIPRAPEGFERRGYCDSTSTMSIDDDAYERSSPRSSFSGGSAGTARSRTASDGERFWPLAELQVALMTAPDPSSRKRPCDRDQEHDRHQARKLSLE